MNNFFIIAAGLVVGALLAQVYAYLRINQLRKQGIYPKPGQATEADVLRLMKSGHKVEAIRCHREVHQSSLKAAKQAVESMAS